MLRKDLQLTSFLGKSETFPCGTPVLQQVGVALARPKLNQFCKKRFLMDVVSIILSIGRKSGIFILVLTVLALIARVEPKKSSTPKPERFPSMAKVAKPKPAKPAVQPAPDSSGWIKGAAWRKNG
ncbi:MAG: hypothetical protein H0X66_06250 [Verrucomicrobia bacterium]|nr:hypothetical protein [Verrucomicrobiota bacterium]